MQNFVISETAELSNRRKQFMIRKPDFIDPLYGIKLLEKLEKDIDFDDATSLS